jgi:hypothetical protein
MVEIKLNTYPNATLAKYNNRRVGVMQLPDNDFAIEFTVLSNDTNQRAIHTVLKNKVVKTDVRVSQEAALSLLVCLQIELKKAGVIQ